MTSICSPHLFQRRLAIRNHVGTWSLSRMNSREGYSKIGRSERQRFYSLVRFAVICKVDWSQKVWSNTTPNSLINRPDQLFGAVKLRLKMPTGFASCSRFPAPSSLNGHLMLVYTGWAYLHTDTSKAQSCAVCLKQHWVILKRKRYPCFLPWGTLLKIYLGKVILKVLTVPLTKSVT